MKPSKRTRERATLLCALAGASAEAMSVVHIALYPSSACNRRRLGRWSPEAERVWRLATDARLHESERISGDVPDDDRYRLSCIYAAVLLSTGWSP